MWNRTKSVFFSPVTWSVLMVVLCIMGIAIVLYSTTWGAGLSDDSYYYISSARNLLAGKGFDLAANFPPVLSLILSAIGIFRVDPLVSIRWLNAILFALNIYLVARIMLTLTRSRAFSILAAFFSLAASALIMIHSQAMSEPLFIALTLCGILVYVTGGGKNAWSIPFGTGIFFGLAAATRYIGIAMLLAGGIFWLTERGRIIYSRVRNTAIFSGVGILPLALWAVRNEMLIGQPTNRVFGIHLIPARLWVNMLNTIFRWFVPGRLVNDKEIFWLVGCVILAVAATFVYLWRNRRSMKSARDTTHLPNEFILIILIMLAYMVILVISRSFFDDRIPMDERLLSPILVLGVILTAWVFARRWEQKRWLEMSLMVVFGLVVLATNATRSVQMVQSYHELGIGYASARDHISETYAYLRNRPDTPIYSNAFAGIYFWTDRVTYPIPLPGNIPKMKADMAKTGALLVIFDSIPVELYGTTQEQLAQGLVEQIRLSEATIYRSP